jgi:tetratricopeptide (TPR) repeat protein
VRSRFLIWQGWWALSDDEDRALVEQGLALLDRPELKGVDVRRERAFAAMRLAMLTATTDLARAKDYNEESLALYRDLGRDWDVAVVLRYVSQIHYMEGAHELAVAAASETLEIFRRLGDPWRTAVALYVLSVAAGRAGELKEAERWGRESVTLGRELQEPELIADGLYLWGTALIQQGDYLEARSAQLAAVATYEELGIEEGSLYLDLAIINLGLGEYDRARTWAVKGQEVAHKAHGVGKAHTTAAAPHFLGCVALVTEEPASAKKLLQDGVALAREVGYAYILPVFLSTLAVAHRRLQELEPMRMCLLEAIQIAANSRSRLGGFSVLSAAALALLDRGEAERTVELYALARRNPLMANSQWFLDVFGDEIAAVAATLPPDLVAAAEARGRERDLWETIAELLEEFGGAWDDEE